MSLCHGLHLNYLLGLSILHFVSAMLTILIICLTDCVNISEKCKVDRIITRQINRNDSVFKL